uniref:Secreted protein n=1 Tax=Steinernema glaseri TaxID=37863 RepID=A0A1I7XYS7_9BILA
MWNRALLLLSILLVSEVSSMWFGEDRPSVPWWWWRGGWGHGGHHKSRESSESSESGEHGHHGRHGHGHNRHTKTTMAPIATTVIPSGTTPPVTTHNPNTVTPSG